MLKEAARLRKANTLCLIHDISFKLMCVCPHIHEGSGHQSRKEQVVKQKILWEKGGREQVCDRLLWQEAEGRERAGSGGGAENELK